MFKATKVRVAVALGAGALSMGAAGAPAMAATQDGLVNVDLTNTNVQVPVGVAADVCGVTANVIATGSFTGNSLCTSTSRPSAQGGSGGGHSNQRGLVNVALVNTNVQIPIGVAANVCGVAVNLLSAGSVAGSTTCSAVSTPVAGV